MEGAGSSALLSAKQNKLLKEDFTPHFSIAAIKKDLDYLIEMADALGRKSHMGEKLRSVLQKSIKSGIGGLDFSAIYSQYKKESE